jgi:hypothetical protein
MVTRYGWLCFALVVAGALPAESAVALPWTKVTGTPPGGMPANVRLLTDGTVLMSGAEGTATWSQWWVFTPDSTGSYVNGTFPKVGNSATGRLFAPSGVLNNGQYLICGGEYICPASTPKCSSFSDRSECELYDPVSRTWTTVADVPETTNDTPSVVLADGRLMIFSFYNALFPDPNNSWIFDSGQWVAAGQGYSQTDLINEGGSELLPDGTIFAGVRAFGRYSADASQWTEVASTATIPGGVAIEEFVYSNDEIGPFVVLYDGRLLVLGGNTHNGLYDYRNDTWALADDTPRNPSTGNVVSHADSPACVENNGKVLTVVDEESHHEGNGPAIFAEYDPSAPSGSQWTWPPYPSITSDHESANRVKMVALPSGKVLVVGAESNGTLWIYTPTTTTPNGAWQPTIASVPYLMFGTFVLDGQQLSGLTNGADFGDDGKADSNYPIVKLTKGTAVTFGKSFGFYQRAPRSNVADTCQFTLPSGLASGAYSLSVVASGMVSSNTVQLTLPAADLGPALMTTLSVW